MDWTTQTHKISSWKMENMLMNPRLLFLTRSAALSALALPICAADQQSDAVVRTPAYGEHARSAHLERLGKIMKASELLGMEVQNHQNEKLGKIEELGVEVPSGRIVFVVLASGGILGVGETTLVLPPRALRCDAPHKVLRLDADVDRLKASPTADLARWDEALQPARVVEAYRYYSQEPYFKPGYQAAEAKPRFSQLGYVQKASKVVGAAVKNRADEKVGKVENLMVDLEGGRILHVILSTEGFLGVGDELHALPPGALQYDTTRECFEINASREDLASGPRFKTGEWPDFNDSAYSSGVYRAYRVEPYFSANPNADNTARNARDQAEGGLTAIDQGSSNADVEMTRGIRKEIVSNKSFSVNARNVKIITVNGRVTLRGPVETEAEKQALQKIAERAAPAAKVDNQLEVKLLAPR